MIITPKEDYQNLKKCSEKRVEVKCDSCGNISITTYANYYLAQTKRGFSGKTSCRKCSNKAKGINRIGKPAWNKGKKLPESQKGKNHPSWKGGSYISSDGYRMIHISKDNTKSKWEHYSKEHIVVIEQLLGRKLNKDEVIHHIDGDKLNNLLFNLFLTTDKNHRLLHDSLQQIAYQLVQVGLISFDKDKEQYVANVKLRELLEHPVEGNQQPSPENGNKVSGKVQRLDGEEPTNNPSTSAEQA